MSSHQTPRATARSRRAVLRVHGKEVALPDGRSIIGRSDACRVVIDDPRVSRRHARIEVQGDRAEVADLDSANGVLINGRAIGRGSHVLSPGDVLGVGGHSLLFHLLDAAVLEEDQPTAGELPPVFTAEEPAPTSHGRRPTKVSMATDLVFQVCEQGLEAGHVEDAARVLRGHLQGMVDAARQRREVPEDKRAQAIAFALRLAHETRSGEWFDFVVELLRCTRVVCSPEVAEKLRQALEKVDSVDAAKLRLYVADLRALPSSMETLRAAQDVDQLAQAALRRHRTGLRHDGDTWRAPPGPGEGSDDSWGSGGRRA